jgi:hypothetical protein
VSDSHIERSQVARDLLKKGMHQSNARKLLALSRKDARDLIEDLIDKGYKKSVNIVSTQGGHPKKAGDWLFSPDIRRQVSAVISMAKNIRIKSKSHGLEFAKTLVSIKNSLDSAFGDQSLPIDYILVILNIVLTEDSVYSITQQACKSGHSFFMIEPHDVLKRVSCPACGRPIV